MHIFRLYPSPTESAVCVLTLLPDDFDAGECLRTMLMGRFPLTGMLAISRSPEVLLDKGVWKVKTNSRSSSLCGVRGPELL